MTILYLLLGLVGLLVGAEMAVRGSLALALRWKWPSWLTGVLLMATGTSLPELFLSSAAAPEHPTMALGNIFGSNAFNCGLVLGLAIFLQGRRRIPYSGVTAGTALPLLAGSLAIFLFFQEPQIPWFAGPALLLAYVALLAVCLGPGARAQWITQQEALVEGEPVVAQWPLLVGILFTLGGFALMALASGWFLDGSLELAAYLGWDEGFAGYLIAAVATSAPELLTSQRAIRHGHPEAVVGNMLGSNAFNLLVVGASISFLQGADIDTAYVLPLLLVNLLATAALVVPAWAQRRQGPGLAAMPAWAGAGFILAYLALSYWVSKGAAEPL